MMISEPRQNYITADEFLAIAQSPEYAGKRIDLIEGVIVEMGQTGGEHGELITQLAGLLREYVRPRKLGRIASGDAGFVVARRPDGRDTMRGIDVAFVAMERAPDGLPSGTVPFAPDLAIEVISPGNVAEDIHEKIRELLAAGTKLIMAVYPNSRTGVAHTRAGARTYEADETLELGDVLPGFRLAVKDIFDI